MEVAGLVLGTLGIAGLFKSCVENFDIVVRAKDFSEEFDLLCTQVGRLVLILDAWGTEDQLMRLASYPCSRYGCSSGASLSG